MNMASVTAKALSITELFLNARQFPGKNAVKPAKDIKHFTRLLDSSCGKTVKCMRSSSTVSIAGLSLFKELGNKQNQSSAPVSKVLLFSA